MDLNKITKVYDNYLLNVSLTSYNTNMDIQTDIQIEIQIE